MGAGVVLLFWLVLAGIYVFFLLLLILLFLLGWWKKWRWLKWFTGVPAAGMILLAFSIVALLTFCILDSMNPTSVFKGTFGEKPSQKISDLHSSSYGFADTGSVYIQFRTTEDEFTRLAPKRLDRKTSEEMEQAAGEGSGKPEWWTYRRDKDWIYYLRENDREKGPGLMGFYFELEYFAFDPQTGTAYYRFLGID